MVKFRGKNMVEISPIVTSDEDEQPEKKSSAIRREIAANENREYNIPFEWGPQGQVEVRSVK